DPAAPGAGDASQRGETVARGGKFFFPKKIKFYFSPLLPPHRLLLLSFTRLFVLSSGGESSIKRIVDDGIFLGTMGYSCTYQMERKFQLETDKKMQNRSGLPTSSSETSPKKCKTKNE
uniref:Uncharacterized protein n=1 Tax=Oryza brachyantha TaxID=4533 RepID=J3LKV0_ORYBR